jgi:hypothetical protein
VNKEQLEQAYQRLAMLHTETMAELMNTRNRMDAMSTNWRWMLLHRIKVILNLKSRWEE